MGWSPRVGVADLGAVFVATSAGRRHVLGLGGYPLPGLDHDRDGDLNEFSRFQGTFIGPRCLRAAVVDGLCAAACQPRTTALRVHMARLCLRVADNAALLG